jgi:DNA-binding CsgD family transcriptional regulator
VADQRQSGGRRPSITTPRQHRVLALIASGGTNKEIAHELGITERGVAAHVTRLLMRFHSPNRAGLIASALADTYTRDALMRTEQAPRPRLESLDLKAFDDSQLLVTVTLSRDHVIAYQNKATRRLVSSSAWESMMARAGRERFPLESAARLRQIADEAFTRALTVTADAMPVRWQNDDGTWDGRLFSCVVQPLLGANGRVEGILWISTTQALGNAKLPP